MPTTARLKAGADHAAPGEDAVVVGCRKADPRQALYNIVIGISDMSVGRLIDGVVKKLEVIYEDMQK